MRSTRTTRLAVTNSQFLKKNRKICQTTVTEYVHKPPWARRTTHSKSRRTAKEVDELFITLSSTQLPATERVKLIEWISEGPIRHSVSKLENIVLSPDSYSRGEVIAAKYAIDDLRSGRPCRDLRNRVENLAIEKGMLSAEAIREQSNLMRPAFLQRMWLWSRPTEDSNQHALDSLLTHMHETTTSESGILFLEEVDGLSPSEQSALLKVLSDRKFEVGLRDESDSDRGEAPK